MCEYRAMAVQVKLARAQEQLREALDATAAAEERASIAVIEAAESNSQLMALQHQLAVARQQAEEGIIAREALTEAHQMLDSHAADVDSLQALMEQMQVTRLWAPVLGPHWPAYVTSNVCTSPAPHGQMPAAACGILLHGFLAHFALLLGISFAACSKSAS